VLPATATDGVRPGSWGRKELTMSLKPWILAAPLALLAACGGGASDSPFTNAAPSYGALSMDLTSADAAAPALAAAPPALLAAAVTADDPCHPHLFVRSHDVVARVNRHLWRFLRRVEAVIARNPEQATDAAQVWERVAGGLDTRFTMTRTSATVFTWKLELKKTTDAAFTTVFDGTIDRTGAAGPRQGAGSMTLDLSALAAVTGEPVAGVLTAQFSTFPAARTVVVDAKDVVWDADANAPGAASAPRSAHYVYDREPGKGGSLLVEEQMVFLCPANPTFLPADVKLVSRWFHPASGGVHGRSDALMTGGQLPAHVPAIAGTSRESDPASAPASACDPLLGAKVPTLQDASQDFDMSGIDFTGTAPYPFPTSP
jgi:hypothetical protein